jgi:hypothetical protein
MTRPKAVEAVEPAVTNLHDPATGLFVGMAFFVLDFGSPTHHVSNVAMPFDGLQLLATSVTCVSTQVLAAPLGGVLRLTTMASSVGARPLLSCTLAPVTMRDNGTPRPSTKR